MSAKSNPIIKCKSVKPAKNSIMWKNHQTIFQPMNTVFSRLNAADGRKRTNKCRTQSEERGVYSGIARKKSTVYNPVI